MNSTLDERPCLAHPDPHPNAVYETLVKVLFEVLETVDVVVAEIAEIFGEAEVVEP